MAAPGVMDDEADDDDDEDSALLSKDSVIPSFDKPMSFLQMMLGIVDDQKIKGDGIEKQSKARQPSTGTKAKRRPGFNFLQRNSRKAPDYTYDAYDPVHNSGARPKYDMNPKCRQGVQQPKQSTVKYQLAPGVPPIEITGDLLQFCSAQFSEIMAGFGQTPLDVVKMTKDWCTWQSVMTNWVGRKHELGHPEWNFRTCAAFEFFMTLVLRNDLDFKGGFGAGDVCTKIFLTIPAVHRVEALIKDAWSAQGGRKLDGGRMALTGYMALETVDKDLLRKVQEYSSGIFKKMTDQRDAFNDMNLAKMDEDAFKQPPTGAPPMEPRPNLPNSNDFPVLLAKNVTRRLIH